MSIPDRSKHDENIAQSLSILGAAGNAALVERNYLLSEENRALLIQNESLLDGAAIRQGYVEEIEARNAALTATALRHSAPPTALGDRQCPRCQHERSLRLGSERARGLYLEDLARQDEEITRLRSQLAGMTRRPTRGQQAVERVEGHLRALWRSLTDPDTKHDTWTLPIACGICAAIFLLVVLGTGR